MKMPKSEQNNQDKRFENLSEMARNIVWAHGDFMLDSEQRVELYGDGVDVEFVPISTETTPASRKFNPLPVAEVSFKDKRANIIINESDYKDFLDNVCRPEKIDGHTAYSYYIGVGVAYRTLDELLARSVEMHEPSDRDQYVKRFINLITKPIKKDDIDFIMSNILDHNKDIKTHARKVFENIMCSEDTRMGRINALRYSVAVHSYAMEQADEQWSLWCSDSRDRAIYAIDFVNACTLELIDEVKLWSDKIKLAEIFNKNNNYNQIVDSIPELIVAGSIPMSMEEVSEIHKLLDY